MVESPIPQDILKYKGKFVANFSVRETVFGALGIAAALAGYFWLFKDVGGSNARMYLSAFVSLPFFVIGFVKLYDQPFEKIAPALVRENFIYPAKRRKETHYPVFEKYEKTRYWLLPESGDLTEDEEKEQEDTGKKSRNKKKKAERKIVVQKSEVYKGFK